MVEVEHQHHRAQNGQSSTSTSARTNRLILHIYLNMRQQRLINIIKKLTVCLQHQQGVQAEHLQQCHQAVAPEEPQPHHLAVQRDIQLNIKELKTEIYHDNIKDYE